MKREMIKVSLGGGEMSFIRIKLESWKHRHETSIETDFSYMCSVDRFVYNNTLIITYIIR